MSEQIEWIPLPAIVRMKVSVPNQEGNLDYPMIAWRWDYDEGRIEYLSLSGFIWPGKWKHENGVTGLAE